MKKIIKEKPSILIISIYSILLIILGITLMTYPALGMINPIYFISIMFYVLSFLSIVTYFSIRKYSDYEYLLISLGNVLLGAFIFLNQTKKEAFILGTGLLLYTIINTIIRGYYVGKYKKNDNYIWTIKLLELILIILMGVLTIINLYNEISVFTIMFGYYFITYGVINLIEPISEYLIHSGYLKELINEISKKK